MKSGRSRLLWVGLPVVTVFTVFVAIVWLAYQENARVPAGEPPLIRAIAAPYKRAPDDPGGRQVADQGAINQLLRDDPGPALPERVLPLPEEPRTPMIGGASRGESAPPAAAGSGEVPATTAGAPSATPPDEPAQSAGAADDGGATREAEAALARLLADVGPEASSAKRPAPAERSAPATPDPVVDAPAARPDPPPSTTAPTIVRRDAPPAPASVDAPSREADQALTRLLAEVAGLPADVSPPADVGPGSQAAAERPQAAAAERPQAVAALAPAEPVESQRTMGPGFRVQLAAVRVQDDARRAWADLADRLGSLVADYEPFYERAETVNGVFYRIQLGPFASEQTADDLCVEVQRRNASCFVVAR